MSPSKFKNANIVYFSGTGGTTRIALLIRKYLEEYGVTSNVIPLEHNTYSKNNNHEIRNTALLIVLFPVHAFDAPEPIYKWVKSLSQGLKTSTVIISVSAGGDIWLNSACRVGIIKKLKKRNFNIIYEKMMIMPSNFMIATEKQLSMWLLKVLPLKIENIVKEIISGKKLRIKPTFGGRLLTLLCKSEKLGAKTFAKSFKVKPNCNGCGWCAKNCPMNNIVMRESKPVFHWNCVACLRCVYGCPKNSIDTKIYSFVVIKEGYNLEKLEKQVSKIDLQPVENINDNFLFNGIKDYIENI